MYKIFTYFVATKINFMKRIFTLSLLFTFFSTSLLAQDVIARWNFEVLDFTSATGNSFTVDVGSVVADSGALVTGSEFSALHASAASAWTTPTGNGSSNSASSTGWAAGDYWQFKVSTTGYSNIGLVWDQMGSNTGPKSFIIQYSTDGTTFTNAPGAGASYDIANDTWQSSNYKAVSTRTLDLSSVTALNNQAFIYIRFTIAAGSTSINGNPIAAGGTSRIDNVYIGGVSGLPLTLNAFTGSVVNGKANLTWATTNEINVDGFDIEKSTNNRDFSSIGFVKANNSTENNYNFTTELSGVSYYRLKMTDKDGSFKYSKTISLNNKQTVKLDLYPNPVRNSTTLSHDKATEKASITITSLDGRKVSVINVVPGATQTTVDVTKLLNGNYIMVYENNGTRSSVQFVKQ